MADFINLQELFEQEGIESVKMYPSKGRDSFCGGDKDDKVLLLCKESLADAEGWFELFKDDKIFCIKADDFYQDPRSRTVTYWLTDKSEMKEAAFVLTRK